MGIQLVNVTRGRRQRVPIVRRKNQIKFFITVSNLSAQESTAHIHAEDNLGNIWLHKDVPIPASSHTTVETLTGEATKSFVLKVSVKDIQGNVSDTKTMKVYVI